MSEDAAAKKLVALCKAVKVLCEKEGINFFLMACKQHDDETMAGSTQWDADGVQMHGMLLSAMKDEMFRKLVIVCLRETMLGNIEKYIAVAESKAETKH